MGRNYDTLEIPCGQGGINRTKNIALVSRGDLAYADGLTIERECWEKELGAAKVNASALTGSADVMGVHEFITGAIPPVQEQIAYIDTGSTASIVTVTSSGVGKTLKTGLTTGKFPVFSEGWDGTQKALYITNGANAMQVYTGGASTSDVPNPAGDWSGTNQPTVVLAHRARNVAFGNPNYPHNVYLSDPGIHGDFAGGESALQRVYPGEGEKLVGGLSWRQRLYLFKYPRGIYVLDDVDPSITNWQVVKITESIGIAGPGCFVVLEDDVIILASDGFFYALSQIRTLGQTEVPPMISLETSEFLKDELNLSRLDLVQSVWYGHKRKAMFVVPATGATQNNRRIDIDMHSGGPKVFMSRRDACPSIGLRRATATAVAKPIIGDNAGFVYDIENTVRAKDGAGFRGQFETPPLALYRGGKRNGNLHELEVMAQPEGSWDVDIEVHRDGVLSETKQFSQSSPGAAGSSISLDSDVIAGNTVANTRHRIVGSCRYLKLVGRNNALNENFRIMNMDVSFTPGNDK